MLKFVIVPPVLLLICIMSSLLTVIVILGRLFSSPLRFQDILRTDDAGDESEGGKQAARDARESRTQHGLGSFGQLKFWSKNAKMSINEPKSS